MTTRRKGVYAHLELFDERDWGLIIYDEVHLLPAPIFRFTADIQSRRRLGLTATLVREDGREGDVFSLIGPKRYDAPWKDIEAQGWIAPADCVEVRVTLHRRTSGWPTRWPSPRSATASARRPARRRRSSRRSSSGTHGDRVLVIGQYLDQLDDLGERLERAGHHRRDDRSRSASGSSRRSAPASCRHAGRQQGRELLRRPARGRRGDPGVRHLRLAPGGGAAARPRAAAQGRRPYGALLHRRVPRHRDQDFAAHRQRFLAEQGYAYRIVDAHELDRLDAAD